jgi:hypothetical protein
VNRLLVIFASGMTGQSMVVASVVDQKIFGADLFGSKIDGDLSENKGAVHLDVKVQVPAGVEIVQGIVAPEGGLEYKISGDMPEDYLVRDYVRLETPYGPIHARFQELRTLD